MSVRLFLKIILLIFSSIWASFINTETINPDNKTTIGSSSRMEFVSWGEVVAIQKDKGVMRVKNEKLNGQKISSCDFVVNKDLVLIDNLNNLVGSFKTTRSEIEAHNGRHSSYCLIYGSFELSKTQKRNYLSVGYQAGLYRELAGFLKPVHGNHPYKHRTALKKIIHHIDKKEMLYIPDDIVIFGQNSNPEMDNYNPDFQNRSEKDAVKIQSFYMDKYEVTNQEYLYFCRQTGRPLPASWRGHQSYPLDKADHPVQIASYRDVEAYANWAQKSIPTEFEWEMAARGGYRSLIVHGNDYSETQRDPPLYPGRDGFDVQKCNTLESGRSSTVSVYQLDDFSIFGIVGMCGNAREWTSSWYDLYPGNFPKNISSRFGKVFKVIRGGSWYQQSKYARSDFRDYGGFPTLSKDFSAGFRLITRK